MHIHTYTHTYIHTYIQLYAPTYKQVRGMYDNMDDKGFKAGGE